MVTNLLNKNDLGLNEIVKQTALATRTRARNVSLNKLGCNKNHFSSSINYVKIEHSWWEFRGVRIFEVSLEKEFTNVLVKESEQELVNCVFEDGEKFWNKNFFVRTIEDTINCLTFNFDPSNDLRSADDIKPLLNQIKNTTLDPCRLYAIITTPEGYEVVSNEDKLVLELCYGKLAIHVGVSLCNDATSETGNVNIGFLGQIAVNNEKSASSLDISRVDFILISSQQITMLQEVDQIHDMESFVMEQNNKK